MLCSGIRLAKPYSWRFKDKTVALIKVSLKWQVFEGAFIVDCLSSCSVCVKNRRTAYIVVIQSMFSAHTKSVSEFTTL